MGNKLTKLLFDKRDHALIRIVNDALSADRKGRFSRKVYFPYLHPHGIKEMTETKGLRSAYAVAQLLSSLEVGGVDERFNALRSLRYREISQLFIDGILGNRFQRPLSFYLSRYEGYLEEVKRLIFDEQLTDSVKAVEPGLRRDTYGPAPVKDVCQAPVRRV